MKQFQRAFVCLSITFCLCRPPVGAQTTTPNLNPSTVTSVAYTGSNFAWTNPGGAAAAGGGTANSTSLVALNSGNTEYLQATDFGFAIPAGATVTGVTGNVTRRASGLSMLVGITTITGTVQDHSVVLTGVPIASVDQASPTNWTGATTTIAYGGTSDTWGTPLTPTIVNSSTFGMSFAATFTGSSFLGVSLLPGADVDVMSVAVTYTMAALLPVSLEHWSVMRQGTANVLNWSSPVTDAEGEFIIERSSNGHEWVDMATVAAPNAASAAMPDAGSAGAPVYQSSYTDNMPFASGPTYYRLRRHSAGEADRWSSVQTISARQLRPAVTLYPNPFTDIINITSPHPFTRCSLTDLHGQTLFVKEYADGGVSNATIPASGLPAGTYFVQVDDATWQLIKNAP